MSCCGPKSVEQRRPVSNQESNQVVAPQVMTTSQVARKHLSKKSPGCCSHSSTPPTKEREPSIDEYSPHLTIRHGWKQKLDPKKPEQREAMLQRAYQIIHGYGEVAPQTDTGCCTTTSKKRSSAKPHRSRTVSSTSSIPIAESPPVDANAR